MQVLAYPEYNELVDTSLLQSTKLDYSQLTKNPAEGSLSIPVVYGFRRVKAIRLLTYALPNNPLQLVVVYALSLGQCRSLEAIYLDGLNYSGTSRLHGQVQQVGDYFRFEFLDGRSDQGRSNILMGLNITDQTIKNKVYNNVCYLVCHFNLDSFTTPRGGIDPNCPFKQVPVLEVDLYGRYLQPYSGSVTSAYSNNAAWVICDILRDNQFGLGLGLDRINQTDFTVAVNYSNTVISGNLIVDPCNYIYDTARSVKENIDTICREHFMHLIYTSGKFTLVSEKNVTSITGLTIDENVATNSIKRTLPSRLDLINTLVAEYQNAGSNFYNYSQTFPTSDTPLTVPTGSTETHKVSLNTLTDPVSVKNFAYTKMRVQNSAETYTFTGTRALIQFAPGDLVILNFQAPTVSNQTALITEMSIAEDLSVSMTCILFDQDNYATYSRTIPELGNQVIPGYIGTILPPSQTLPPVIPPPPPSLPSITAQVTSVVSTYTLTSPGFSSIRTVRLTNNSASNVTNLIIIKKLKSSIKGYVEPTTLGLSQSITVSVSANSILDVQDNLTVPSDSSALPTEEVYSLEYYRQDNGDYLATDTWQFKRPTVVTPPPATDIYKFTSALDSYKLSGTPSLETAKYLMTFDYTLAQYGTDLGFQPARTNNYGFDLRIEPHLEGVPSTSLCAFVRIYMTLVDPTYLYRDTDRKIYVLWENRTTPTNNPGGTTLGAMGYANQYDPNTSTRIWKFTGDTATSTGHVMVPAGNARPEPLYSTENRATGIPKGALTLRREGPGVYRNLVPYEFYFPTLSRGPIAKAAVIRHYLIRDAANPTSETFRFHFYSFIAQGQASQYLGYKDMTIPTLFRNGNTLSIAGIIPANYRQYSKTVLYAYGEAKGANDLNGYGT